MSQQEHRRNEEGRLAQKRNAVLHETHVLFGVERQTAQSHARALRSALRRWRGVRVSEGMSHGCPWTFNSDRGLGNAETLHESCNRIRRSAGLHGQKRGPAPSRVVADGRARSNGRSRRITGIMTLTPTRLARAAFSNRPE